MIGSKFNDYFVQSGGNKCESSAEYSLEEILSFSSTGFFSIARGKLDVVNIMYVCIFIDNLICVRKTVIRFKLDS